MSSQIARAMKCSHCGYEFNENEVVKFSVYAEGHDKLKNVRTEEFAFSSLKKKAIECPKCRHWLALK